MLGWGKHVHNIGQKALSSSGWRVLVKLVMSRLVQVAFGGDDGGGRQIGPTCDQVSTTPRCHKG